MFGLGTGLLIKIGLAVLLVGGGWFALHSHFKHDRENLQALGAANERIAYLEASVANRDADVLELNNRIRARNEQTKAYIAKTEAAQAEATAAAVRAAADKKRSDIKLREAQNKYLEVLNRDESVRNYSAATVPAAVLDRLRSANGEGGDDTVRAGPASGGPFQTAAGGTFAWLQMPITAPGWQHQ